jgi:hypothetical protein
MQTNTKYDHAARKKARRSGREKGFHVYVPAEVLGALAERDDLWYQLGGGERGRVIVTFHKTP